MVLKNYTSQVPAYRSISWIERKLASCGSRQILKMYDDDGQVNGLAFTIPIEGLDMAFKLPAQVAACETTLLSMRKRVDSQVRKRIKAQAERTASRMKTSSDSLLRRDRRNNSSTFSDLIAFII